MSQHEYYSFTDSAICVLPDQATVLGVNSVSKNTVLKENICDARQPVISYNHNPRPVHSLVLDQPGNTFLAANDFRGDTQIVQYDLESGKAVKVYRLGGAGSALSSCRVRSLCFFGSAKSFSFAVLDACRKRIVCPNVKTAVKCLFCLQACESEDLGRRSKMLLVVSGVFLRYVENRSDIFDITGLVENLGEPSTRRDAK